MSIKTILSVFSSPFQRRPHFWSAVRFILANTIVSFLLVAIFNPPLLIWRNLSFMWQHDTGIPYESVFNLVSQYYHGGIQLWNRYDQMGYAYSHLTSGIYTLSNFFVAAVYLLLSPFFKYPGEALHGLHPIAFHVVNIFIRTAGGYLLARKFCRNSFVIFISLLYLNTLLSSQMYAGLLTNNLYSLWPLLAYFILRFFEEFRLNDFLAAFLVLTVAVATSPFFALGYFYQAVHFFIVTCVIWKVFHRKKGTPPRPAVGRPFLLRGPQKALRVVLVLFLGALILLPSVVLFKPLKSDFYLEGSGFGNTQGRLKNVLNPSRYFQAKNQSQAHIKFFFKEILDFRDNRWFMAWMFVGLSTLFFAGLGLLFSKYSQKYIFAGTILLIILANAPQDPHSLFSVAHWVNALTNPFSFLLRSFHMTDLLMPYFFFPLVALGLEGMRELLNKEAGRIYSRRVPVALLATMAAISYFAVSLPLEIRVYAIAISVIFLFLLYDASEDNSLSDFLGEGVWGRVRRPFLIALLVLLGATELTVWSVYMNNDQYSRREIAARSYEGLDQSIPLILDFQNPRILPFREYFRLDREIEPRLATRQNNYGLFYQYTPFERCFFQPEIYAPRHSAYKDMVTDQEMRQYLQRDKHLVALVDYAVRAAVGNFTKILAWDLQEHVAMVETQRTDLPCVLEKLPRPGEVKFPALEPQVHFLKSSFAFSDAQTRPRGSLVEYAFDFPRDFPSYFSTTVFTEDRNSWKVHIAGQELKPVQGKLTEPFSFDVQNVQTGKLVVLLPGDFNVSQQEAALELKLPENLSNIWRNEHDNFGFTYRVLSDGWMILHFPYDTKWQISVDGKSVEFFRVNKYFMGMPVVQGEHRILLRYWPGTPLRIMIVVSMLAMAGVFFTLLGWGISEESKTREDAPKAS